MTKQIKPGMTLTNSGNNFKVKSVDVLNVNLTNGQKIPIQLIDSIFTAKGLKKS